MIGDEKPSEAVIFRHVHAAIRAYYVIKCDIDNDTDEQVLNKAIYAYRHKIFGSTNDMPIKESASYIANILVSNAMSDKRKITSMLPCYISGCNKKYKTEKKWLEHLMGAHGVTEPTQVPDKIDVVKGIQTKNASVVQEDVQNIIDRVRDRQQQLKAEHTALCESVTTTEREKETLKVQLETIEAEREEILKQYEQKQKHTCNVCYTDTYAGAQCFDGHFTCPECLTADITHNGFDRVTADGEVKCLVPECHKYFKLNDIFKFIPMENIMKFATGKIRQQVQTGDVVSDAIVQRYFDHITGKILSMCCPRCSQVFVDFNGCCALSCSTCPCNFCAWCLEDTGDDSQKCHAHVIKCPFGNGRFFADSMASVDARMKQLRTQKLRNYWQLIDKADKKQLVDRINPLLGDLVDTKLTV